ncbi:hypothetical protein SBDP1_1210015 [Syntrophobacter sp. SbD1]|nr:hypothetical protein SBDP1_1210015 [Syntrophobacter sp. SbD1]
MTPVSRIATCHTNLRSNRVLRDGESPPLATKEPRDGAVGAEFIPARSLTQIDIISPPDQLSASHAFGQPRRSGRRNTEPS